jgi:hypothetical protein
MKKKEVRSSRYRNNQKCIKSEYRLTEIDGYARLPNITSNYLIELKCKIHYTNPSI